MSVEELTARVAVLEHCLLKLPEVIQMLAEQIALHHAALEQHQTALEIIADVRAEATPQTPPPPITDQPPIPALPPEGYLDVERYVTGRVGYLDMPLANHFGQTVARAAANRPEIVAGKVQSPGEHWTSINTWPIDFLREIWYATYGGKQ